MQEWWEALTVLQRVFVYIALPATIILAIQLLLLLFGMGFDHSDIGDFTDTGAHGIFDHADIHDISDANAHGVFDHADHGLSDDGSPPHDLGNLRLLTLRGVVAFFAVLGWCGFWLSSYPAIPLFVILPVSLGAGLLSLYTVAKLFSLVLKLQDSGNIKLINAVGQTGEVYLTIPPHRGSYGKVTVMVQERLGEYDAITDDPNPIETGAGIVVTDITDNNILVVERNESNESSL